MKKYCSAVVSETVNPTAPFIFSGDLKKCIADAAHAGFSGVELQLANPNDYGIDGEELIQCANDHHILITSVATGLSTAMGLCMTSPSDQTRQATIDHLKKYIDFAQKCIVNSEDGILRQTFHPIVHLGLIKGLLSDCESREAYLDRFKKGCRELSEYAQSKGVNIAVEPLNHYDGDILNTWEETAPLLEGLPDNIGFSVDLYHMRMEEKDFLSTIKKYSSKIKAVQLMDDNRRYPGAGSFKMDKIADVINSTGYAGPIIMECLPLPSPERAAAECIKFFKKHFEKSCCQSSR